MNSQFFEKAGRITYSIITALTEVPVLAVKTLAVAVPLFTFWIGVGLIAFCDVTLMQIIEQPKNVLSLALMMSIVVMAYRVLALALRGERKTFYYTNDKGHASQ
ncbi:hypothetical protein [Escherichia coli]|uniref:hypothetical protein n=1 Tax=Escherichia coli TaxID=562 RepID=UPI000BE8C076|nr:hypothetical protein [Escherichia coli]